MTVYRVWHLSLLLACAFLITGCTNRALSHLSFFGEYLTKESEFAQADQDLARVYLYRIPSGQMHSHQEVNTLLTFRVQQEESVVFDQQGGYTWVLTPPGEFKVELKATPGAKAYSTSILLEAGKTYYLKGALTDSLALGQAITKPMAPVLIQVGHDIGEQELFPVPLVRDGGILVSRAY